MPELCFLLAMLFPPVIIFWMRPSDPAWQRLSCVLFAAVMCFSLLLLTCNVSYTIVLVKIGFFQSKFPYCAIQMCFDEPRSFVHKLNPFALILWGCLSSLLYAIIWEYLWRDYHRLSIRILGKGYRGVGWILGLLCLAYPLPYIIAIHIVIHYYLVHFLLNYGMHYAWHYFFSGW